MKTQLKTAIQSAVMLSVIRILRQLIESTAESLGDQHPVVKQLQESLKVAMQYKPLPYSAAQQ